MKIKKCDCCGRIESIYLPLYKYGEFVVCSQCKNNMAPTKLICENNKLYEEMLDCFDENIKLIDKLVESNKRLRKKIKELKGRINE